MATSKATETSEVVIQSVESKTIGVCILGNSPLILNRMSQKVWHELLAPKGKRSASEKATTLKHQPIDEFRASPYIMMDPATPTLLAILPTSFKRAMGTAALDVPGARKAQIGRLVYVQGEQVGLYGVPRVFMAITRSADIGKTPDVRTRAILPEWACELSITFTTSVLRESSIVNLLAAAGLQSGVGDWRQEKGSGSYGAFKIVNKDDKDFMRIVKTQGRKAQQEAMDNPVAYNDETAEMLAWFDVEIKRRGFHVAA
jgi:hypothetical protein